MEMKKHRRSYPLSCERAADASVGDPTWVVVGSVVGVPAVFHGADLPHVRGVAGRDGGPADGTHGVRDASRSRPVAWHHSRAHWFFSRARWSVEQVGLALLGLAVTRLVPAGAPVLVAVDDTLFRRSGRRVHAAGWHHDGAAKGPAKHRVSWGNSWVLAGIVVDLPFTDRPLCLPVAFALWCKGGPTKQVLAGRLVTAIATACPDRAVHVVADAWYAGVDGAAGAAQGRTYIAAHRRENAPWYRSKTQPAYLDMIVQLRRTLIAARFRAGNPRNPTPAETLAVLEAWAEAAA
jgi:DDE superfamily endonuclease